MVRKTISLLLVIILHYGRVEAQAMDNTLAYRNITGDKYFRINYENDFFAAFDRDYTQGILIEKVHPGLKSFPFMKILWHPKESEIKYGLAIEHNAYTPNDISQYEIQYGDRPYAGVLMLKSFLIADDFNKKTRISVSFNTGIIGPAAGGEQMQRTIHHWINYTQPEGWHNQIQNDLVLNYQVNVEKAIIENQGHFLVSAYGSARLGTLSDKVSAGFTASLGNFNSPYAPMQITKKPFQWYAYFHLAGNAVGYDATLQGGVFNHSSVYTIEDGDINRFTMQDKFGLVLIFRSLYLEYYRTGTTEEFKTSIYHRTGGLQIGFGF
jgi:lipid A 3-O-deacylase